MEKRQRTERNCTRKVQITEIPSSGEKQRYNCPYCDTPTHVGKGANAICDGVTTVCKRCKRMLSISDLIVNGEVNN